MIRRKKEQVLKDLPDKTRQVIELPHTLSRLVKAEYSAYSKAKEARASIKLIRQQVAQELVEKSVVKDRISEMADVVAVSFGELAKVRKELSMKKLPICEAHIKTVLESVDSLVVFTYHKDPAYELAKSIESSAVITGDTPIEERNQIVEKFQNGEIRVIIGTTGAMGTGLTLTRASNVIMLELDWTPANLEQAEDRCHRIGQDNSVLVQYLVLYGSLDAKMMNKVCVKGKLIREALDEETA